MVTSLDRLCTYWTRILRTDSQCVVQDDATKQRSKQRTGRLYQHGHCVPHDIITGQQLKVPCTVPQSSRVLAPWER